MQEALLLDTEAVNPRSVLKKHNLLYFRFPIDLYEKF